MAWTCVRGCWLEELPANGLCKDHHLQMEEMSSTTSVEDPEPEQDEDSAG